MPYFDGRGLRHNRSGYCIWCTQKPLKNKSTTEHFIPRWVIRAFNNPFPPEHNHLTACLSCNGSRGAMPPALYASVRGGNATAGALAKAHTYWSGVASLFSDTYVRFGPPLAGGFRESVLLDFCALIPTETGIYDHRADTWPIYHIRDQCPRSPSKQEWIDIANGYAHREIASAASKAINEVGGFENPPIDPHRARAWDAFRKWQATRTDEADG